MPPSSKRTARRVIAPTYGVAAVAFTAALGGLVAQVQAGVDPALGATKEASLDVPHYVIVHHVVRRKVVTKVVHDLPPGTEAAIKAAKARGQHVSAATVASIARTGNPAPVTSGGSSGGGRGGSSGGGSTASVPVSSAPAASAPVASAPAASAPVAAAPVAAAPVASAPAVSAPVTKAS